MTIGYIESRTHHLGKWSPRDCCVSRTDVLASLTIIPSKIGELARQAISMTDVGRTCDLAPGALLFSLDMMLGLVSCAGMSPAGSDVFGMILRRSNRI